MGMSEPNGMKGARRKLRLGDAVGFSGAPLWALNADHDYYRRKLELARGRRKTGRPPHKRYATYEVGLVQKLTLIDTEIERRKGAPATEY